MEEATHRIGENLCQSHISQGTDNQNIQRAQKTNFFQNQWINKEMGKW
jgi:hypothetical protein